MTNYWSDKRVVVLGGAALIGSHLIEALLGAGCRSVLVADNFSSGKADNLPPATLGRDFLILPTDLRIPEEAALAVRDADVVFHLASQHGGRGYVSGHAPELFDNLALDTTIFRACADAHVPQVIFASSACAYPIDLQTSSEFPARLVEGDIDYAHMRQADGIYGMEKLMAEVGLDAYTRAGAFGGIATRFFTVYGPRMNESHAICALIAKAFVGLDPFPVWGYPQVVRNWTFIEDVVSGLMLAPAWMHSGPVNIGSECEYTVAEAVHTILELMGHTPREIVYQHDKPIGPVGRLSNSAKARGLLGWQERTAFRAGLQRTIDWYVATHDRATVAAQLERSLTER